MAMDSPMGSIRLGIDFGTSHTVAMIGGADRPGRALLFEGSPLLPSAVFATADELIVGRFALQQGRRAPASLEPHPKRRIDQDAILLGEREVDPADAIAAVLARVRAEAERVAGAISSVTVTVPAVWGPTRRQVIAEAADRAALGAVRLVPEPVASAAYFVRSLGHRIEDGQAVVVYDLGAGTFDATVVARRGSGFAVLTQDGRGDLGGLDIDAMIADHLGSPALRDASGARASETGDRTRGYQALLEEIRLAKESLSTYNRAEFTDPRSGADAHLTRVELETLARPLLAQTVKVTEAVITAAGLAPEQTAGVFLVGGASRMPLAATLLHRALGIAPTAIEQPELVVAEGGLIAGPEAGNEADGETEAEADEVSAANGETSKPSTAGPEPGEAVAPVFDYRPRPVRPHRDPAPDAPPQTAAEPRQAGRAARRTPGPVVAAAVLLAVQAVLLIPLWGGAIETGIEEGALYERGGHLLFGAALPLLALAMCASAAAVPLLLRRVRWAPVLGVYTALATLVPVLSVLPNTAAIDNWKFLLGLLMVAVLIAVVAHLSKRASQDWFDAAPRAGGRRARTDRGVMTAGQVLGAVLGVLLLMALLNDAYSGIFR